MSGRQGRFEAAQGVGDLFGVGEEGGVAGVFDLDELRARGQRRGLAHRARIDHPVAAPRQPQARHAQFRQGRAQVGVLQQAQAVGKHAGGRLAAPIAAVVKDGGSTVKVAKMWEREAGRWIERAARERDLVLEKGAADALVQRFGTDTGSMNRALDQLREHRGKITSDLVLNRFKNRPEEPLFMFMDAIEKGRAGEALRRLGDFLTHNHPLVVVAALDNDLRRRSLAAAAPDRDTLFDWLGAKPSDRRADRLWKGRGRVAESALRRAQEAVLRADRVLKSHPEDTHRVTLERLTVALCRWYS